MKRFSLGAAALLAAALALAPVAADAPAVQPNTRPVVEGNTQFAIDLYHQLRTQDGNLFCSPFSISTALAMTSSGARGRTLEQMTRALHLPDQKDLHPSLGHLLREVNGGGRKRGYQLRAVNALFGQKGHPFLKDFIALNRKHYGAGLQEVDFRDDTEGARRTINGWVEKQTNEKIKELIKPRVLRSNDRLVLTNAIHFQGEWSTEFKKENTRDGDFHVAPGRKVTVPLMHQTARYGYAEDRDVLVLGMPYKGTDLDMVVVLPRDAGGLTAVEKNLTPAKLNGWLKALRTRTVAVTFPRFQMTSAFELKRPLMALGMTDAFGGSADFSGMDGTSTLYLAAVIHQAHLDVNEKGTEAAAATAVVARVKSKPLVTEFRADHPFLLLIRDFRSGSILFLGRVVSPR
jgi:serpin B